MGAQFVKGSLVAILAVLTTIVSPTLCRAGSTKNFMTVINGAQQPFAVASGALGNGILTYDTKTKTLCYSLSYVGTLAGGETVAHIHGPAAPGVSAGVILALPLGAAKSSCVVAPAAPFNASDLLKNLYYVNIHSLAWTGGEIRGQILRIK